MESTPQNRDEGVVAGRNAVLEALRAGREIDCLLVERGNRSGQMRVILAMAKERGVTVKEVSPARLEHLCASVNHQGVAAVAAARETCSLSDILDAARQAGEAPFLILCDEIEDPHNLGAIIRTAEACGAHGVVIPKRRSAGLSYAVAKAASGALEYMRVARVPNLPAAMKELKQAGVWIYGADMTGGTWCEQDFSGPAALVIGSEGRGIGRLVRETCDAMVSLPMAGKINSLNASVAAGVLMYEIARQRRGIAAFGPSSAIKP